MPDVLFVAVFVRARKWHGFAQHRHRHSKTVFPGRVTSNERKTEREKGEIPSGRFFFRNIHGVITALFVFLGAHGGRVTQ